jgi:ribosome recycling factor
MLDKTIKEMDSHMEKAIKLLHDELAKLRTGRASTALLDGVKVDYYGTLTPLNQMATISVPEPRMLVVQAWDQSAIHNIEKAIMKADLGITPQNDGKVIRLPIPLPNEERRKELVKLAHKYAEETRVAVRNVRRTGMDELKKAEKEKKMTEDDHKKGSIKVQEITDAYIKKIDQLVEAKSKEILEV